MTSVLVYMKGRRIELLTEVSLSQDFIWAVLHAEIPCDCDMILSLKGCFTVAFFNRFSHLREENMWMTAASLGLLPYWLFLQKLRSPRGPFESSWVYIYIYELIRFTTALSGYVSWAFRMVRLTCLHAFKKSFFFFNLVNMWTCSVMIELGLSKGVACVVHYTTANNIILQKMAKKLVLSSAASVPALYL